MLCPLLATSVDNRSDYYWYANLAAKHVRPISGLVDNRIDGEQHEIHSRMYHNGPHTCQCSTNRGSSSGILRYRRIENTISSKFFVYLLHARAYVPWTPQTLTNDEHSRITSQELCVSLADSASISYRSHTTS